MAYTRGVTSGQRFFDSSRRNPYQKYNWIMEIDGFVKAGFNKCTGLEKKVNVVEYRDGGDNNHKRKEPGWVDFPTITLERGMSQDPDMHQWSLESMNLDGVRKTATQIKRNMTLSLHDPRQEPVRRWNIYECWVVGYSFDDLDAESDDFLIEKMEIAHEGWEEVSI